MWTKCTWKDEVQEEMKKYGETFNDVVLSVPEDLSTNEISSVEKGDCKILNLVNGFTM
jgi:hypothetical protein